MALGAFSLEMTFLSMLTSHLFSLGIVSINWERGAMRVGPRPSVIHTGCSAVFRDRLYNAHLTSLIEEMLPLIVLQKRDTTGGRVSRWDGDLSRRQV